ncbi:GNAT family N-acetyltransferase [Microbacterium sp. NPDC096154]|uniref:GNAT family N-acetyltransferase n=1 Tax=Microbacterium sp. NPDC096154 TaxID=3155549 RepID=UPI0033185DC7
MTDITLDAAPGDAEEAIAVMHAAFAQYSAGHPSGALLETAASLRSEMREGQGLAVVRRDGRMVAVAKHRVAGDRVYFGRLGVLPSSRGLGLASALVRALRAHALDLGLSGLECSVRADEPGNIALYEHLGMRVVRSEERASLTGRMTPVVVMRDPG